MRKILFHPGRLAGVLSTQNTIVMEEILTGTIVIREGSGYPCVHLGGGKLAPVLIDQRQYATDRVGQVVKFTVVKHPCPHIISDYGFAIIAPKED